MGVRGGADPFFVMRLEQPNSSPFVVYKSEIVSGRNCEWDDFLVSDTDMVHPSCPETGVF